MKTANEKPPKKLARLKVLEVLGKRCLAGIEETVYLAKNKQQYEAYRCTQ